MALPAGVKKIPLPDDYSEKAHRAKLEAMVNAQAKGFSIIRIDEEDERVAYIAKLRIDDGVMETEEMPLAKTTKESHGKSVAQTVAAQKDGWEILSFQPVANMAIIGELEEGVSRVRRAVASRVGVEPWDVRVTALYAPDLDNTGAEMLVRYDLQLPDKYDGSKHLSGLWYVAQSIVGNIGWKVTTDEYQLKASLHSGKPPKFPGSIEYPFDPPESWNIIPFGDSLFGGVAEWNLSTAPHLMLQGESGTGKSVTALCLITGALLRNFELCLVDPTKDGLDFMEFKSFCRPSGWGCESLEEALAAVGLVYEEGKRRKALLKEQGAVKWTEMPKGHELRPILVLVDEAMSLFNFRNVPKGIPKDDPLAVEIQTETMLRATILDYLERAAAELRFVGIHVCLAGQKFFADPFKSVKINLGARVLCGAGAPDNDRKVALRDPTRVPSVPDYVRDDPAMSRGVGAYEQEGSEPGIFKGYFSPVDEMVARVRASGAKSREEDEIRPKAEEIARFIGAISPKDDSGDEEEEFDEEGNALPMFDGAPAKRKGKGGATIITGGGSPHSGGGGGPVAGHSPGHCSSCGGLMQENGYCPGCK